MPWRGVCGSPCPTAPTRWRRRSASSPKASRTVLGLKRRYCRRLSNDEERPMTADETNSRISRSETMWTLVHQAHEPEQAEMARAQEAVLQRYTGAIYRYLLGVLRDTNAADEVFQEFALKFVRGAFRHADP